MGAYIFPTFRDATAGLPQPVLTSSDISPLAAGPRVDAAGCPQYWGQFRYGTFRALNRAAGGNFASDTDQIRAGYYWRVLQASGHLETSTSGVPLLWFLCPESCRGQLPGQGASATTYTAQPPGVAVSAALAPLNPNSPVSIPGFTDFGVPAVPLIIPNGFFLRCATANTAAGTLANVALEVRAIFIELPVDDPGPNW